MTASPLARSGSELPRTSREALLGAARELLGEHGGSRFSLAKVATRARCNVALVSYHFGGKEQMLLAVLDQDADALLRPLDALKDANIPVVEKLRRHIAGMIEVHARRPYLGALTHELLRRSEPPVREVVAEKVVRPVMAFQAALLDQGLADGAFRPVDPLAFYLTVVGAVDMLFSARATLEYGFGVRSEDPALRARIASETMALVLTGIRCDARSSTVPKEN